MNLAIAAVIAIGSYSAGICTMCLVELRRGKLVERIGADLVPPRSPMSPPPQRIEPQRTSPFAPPPRPPQKPARKRQIHWPIARAERERPPPMVKVEPRNEPLAEIDIDTRDDMLPSLKVVPPNVDWGVK